MTDNDFKVYHLYSRLKKLREQYRDNLLDFEVSANKINGIPCLIIKDDGKVVECIVLQKSNYEWWFWMIEKREYFGINIIRSENLPLQVYNEKEDKWEIIHMTQVGDTIYVSEKLFEALEHDLQKRW